MVKQASDALEWSADILVSQHDRTFRAFPASAAGVAKLMEIPRSSRVGFAALLHSGVDVTTVDLERLCSAVNVVAIEDSIETTISAAADFKNALLSRAIDAD